MNQRFLLLARLNASGAAVVADVGLARFVEDLSARIAASPGNGTVELAYACEDHAWDLVLIGENAIVPGYWGAAQLRGRVANLFETTQVLSLATLEQVDEHLLAT